MSLMINYMGPHIQQMTWLFEIQTTSNTWVKIGDNSKAAGWNSWTYDVHFMNNFGAFLTQIFSILTFEISQSATNLISNGEIRLRYFSYFLLLVLPSSCLL